jgi:hypothetical protein
MKKDFMLFLIFGLTCGLFAAGCSEDNDSEPSDSETGAGDDTETSSSPTASCALDIIETFDAAVPTGWTVIAGGSGSGSGSGSASGSSGEGESDETWHHTTEADTSYKMDGGCMFVGGYAGMNESLVTDYYELGSCTAVTMSFTHYFDDFRGDDDRGELWFMGDAPPWTQIGTYSSNDNKEAVTETVDLSSYVLGQSGFQLKFVFADEGQGNYGWAVDDVKILGSK